MTTDGYATGFGRMRKLPMTPFCYHQAPPVGLKHRITSRTFTTVLYQKKKTRRQGTDQTGWIKAIFQVSEICLDTLSFLRESWSRCGLAYDQPCIVSAAEP
jgi:hypothetical protein